MNRTHVTRAIAAGLLLVMYSQMVLSAVQKAPTYDEQGFIARGYAFVKLGDLHIRIGTPILLNALNALPLLALPDVRLPVDTPSWSGTDFHPIGERFLWRVNDNADQVTFLARVPTMMLAVLLAVFVYRWARDLYGPWGGLLALTLCAFDPNIIAHGRLTTTDLGSSALLFIATYWIWKVLVRPTWMRILASGIFLGLAQAAKFSSLVFLPIWALLFLWRVFEGRFYALPYPASRLFGGEAPRQRWQNRLAVLGIIGLLIVVVAILALWAAYGFEVGPIPGVTFWPVLAPSHLEQLIDLSGRLTGEAGREAPAFLMGQCYTGGRWPYFFVALAAKTPIPTLVLLVAGLLLSLRKRTGPALWALWLPPAIYFAFSLTSKLNLGYRYILPVLPFLLVIAGRTGEWLAASLSQLSGRPRALKVAAASILVGWSAWSAVAVYPHYLAFFNEWAGGPENGWRLLVDSNIDWGQDLKGLGRWMDANSVQRVKLGYMGEAYPSYYGIAFDPLPSQPDRWSHPLYHDLYPLDPAPGIYAISATLLQGCNLPDPDTYAWFREREPIDKVGHSIFIYHVPRYGEPEATVALSGISVADIRPEDYAQLGTNDVRVLWFDIGHALYAPASDVKMLLFAGGDAHVPPELAPLWPDGPGQPSSTRDGRPLRVFEGNPRNALETRIVELAPSAPVWHLPATQFAPGDPPNHGQQLAYPVQFGDRVELLAYEVHWPSAGGTALRPGETLTLTTYWRARPSGTEPLKLFVHLLDANSTYMGGDDRLDVWYENWETGDLFVQAQHVALQPDIAPGEYQVEIGWYNPETMQRLQVMPDDQVIADRVLLSPVQVRE